MMPHRTIWFLLIISVFVNNGFAQVKTIANPWEFTAAQKSSLIAIGNLPTSFRSVQLNVSTLKTITATAPLRSSKTAIAEIPILSIPLPDGTFGTFKIVEAPVLHPDLGKQFPNIRSYAGWGIEDPSAYIRFDYTPNKGFHAIIFSGEHATVLIDKNDISANSYLVYYKKDTNKKNKDHFSCTVKSTKRDLQISNTSQSRQAGDCQLRKYRLALACTGEYAQYHGGTLADVLAAMNATMTRVNGLFEREVSVTMEIIPANTAIIFLNSFTDPYSNFDGAEMLGENQETLDEEIGTDNYDIGHVFSTAGGGVAGLGVVCSEKDKALGVTGFDIPEGDQFDIDFVAHEMGHQFGAEHSFNGTAGSCAGNNWEATSMEPGGGSTIMSYAGICEEHDVQDHSDAYFHAISLEQISTFLMRDGNSCAALIDFNNEAPTALAGENVTIPKSTPFFLTGSATDADEDVLSFTWEQMDKGTAPQPPRPTNARGPLFRSVEPASSPTRYFPNLPDLVNNRNPTWEVLPGVRRDMNFRFTVRDNKLGGGCSAEDDIKITVNSLAGPFEVISPNTSILWTQGDTEEVTWDVAGTTRSPIDAAEVDICLSLDGGYTYPEVLVKNVPNTGSAEILVPGLPTRKARIMVKASDNIFFDISDRNFEIEAILDNFTIAPSTDVQEICSTQEGQYKIDIGVSGQLEGIIELSTEGLPTGITATFSENNFTPPTETTLTLQRTGEVAAGTYDFTLNVLGSTGLQTRALKVIIINEGSGDIIVTSPISNAKDIEQNPILEWEAVAGIKNYTIRIANSPTFDSIWEETQLTENQYTIEKALDLNSRYYWEVIGMGDCLSNISTGINTFTTSNINCKIFDSMDVPIEIPRAGTPSIVSTINIPEMGKVTDINVLNLKIDHSFIADLAIGLSSPKETVVLLTENICLFEENLDLNFDDASTSTYNSIPCPPIGGGTYQPFQALEAYIGEEMNGTWNLAVLDLVEDDGGRLKNWALEVCYLQEAANLPLGITIDKINETCIGANDGRATVTALDGTGNYTYTWSNGATTALIDDLSPGTYTVTIDDGTTNIVSNITVKAAVNFSVSPSVTHPTCRAAADGRIELKRENLITEYAYNWSTGETTSSVNSLESGAYEVLLTDNKGCTEKLNFVLNDPPEIVEAIIATNTTCSAINDGSVVLSLVDSGNDSYTYEWSNGENTQSINNLLAGAYTVTVTSADNCAEVLETIVESPDSLGITIKTRATTCNGLSDGQMNVEVQGGTAPYKFNWNPSSTSSDLRNLAVGIYDLTVTDANNCTQIASAIIEAPERLSINATVTDINCNGLEAGRIDAMIIGGTSPYTYVWGTGQTTNAIGDLPAGVYELTIKDANNCEKTTIYQVEEPAPIDIEISTTELSQQNAMDGRIITTVSGGSGAYIYEWDNEATTPILDSLAVGIYIVTITDASGCSKVASAEVSGVDCLDLVIDFSSTYPKCDDLNIGAINAVVSGGTSPYRYSWASGDTLLERSNLSPGTYTLMVTDSLNCTVEATNELTALSTISIQLADKTAYSCQNDTFGNATVVAEGGQGVYTYRWSDKQGQTTAVATDLINGLYTVTVTDEASCSNELTVEILNEDELVIPVFLDEYTLYLDSSGQVNVQPDMFLLALVDSCSVISIQLSKLLFDCGDLGRNTMNLITNFTSDTIIMSELVVDIVDTIPPLVQCPEDITTMNACNDTIFYEILATDNCEFVKLERIKGFQSGSVFPQGITDVVYLGTDTMGNETTCSFQVIVDTDLLIEPINADINTDTIDGIVHDLEFTASLYCGSDFIAPKGGVEPYQITKTPITDQPFPVEEAYSIEVIDAVGCSVRGKTERSLLDDLSELEIAVIIVAETSKGKDGAIQVEIEGDTSLYEFVWFQGDKLLASGINLQNLVAGMYTLKIESLVSGCTKTYDYVVNLSEDGTVSTDDLTLNSQIIVSPNPSSGLFKIQVDLEQFEPIQIDLYNLSGQSLGLSQTAYTQKSSFLLDVSTFPKGIYVAKIRVGKATVLRKIVVF